MGTKSRWLLAFIFIIALYYLVSYGYSYYKKTSKDKWLSRIDITSFLIETKDLPYGYSPGSIKNLEPNDYSRFVQGKEQEIITPDGSIVGTVRVYLFSLKTEQEEMYNFLSLMETPEGMIPLDVADIGEMHLAAIDPFGLIVFTRCTAVGYLQINLDELQKGYDTDLLIAHAKRIDEQLKTIACEQP
jgi:hypothetical protein